MPRIRGWKRTNVTITGMLEVGFYDGFNAGVLYLDNGRTVYVDEIDRTQIRDADLITFTVREINLDTPKYKQWNRQGDKRALAADNFPFKDFLGGPYSQIWLSETPTIGKHPILLRI